MDPIKSAYSQTTAAVVGLLLFFSVGIKTTVAQAPVVQSTATYENSTAATSHTIDLPSSMQSGDLLVMVLRLNGSSRLSTHTGWSVLKSYLSTTTTGSNPDAGATYVLTRTAETTNTASFTLNSSSRLAAVTYRITGAMDEPVASLTAGVNPPNLVTGFGDLPTMFIAGTTSNLDPEVTKAPTDYTDFISAVNSASKKSDEGVSVGVWSAVRSLRALSDDPGAFTVKSGVRAHAVTIALKGAALPKLTVTAVDVNRDYTGSVTSSSDFSVTYAGWVSGDSENSNDLQGTITFGAAASGVNAGTYAITPGGLTSETYELEFVPAVLTINKINPTVVSASGYDGVYDGKEYGASVTLTGVGGVSLTNGLTLGSKFKEVPGGTASWSYTDPSGNYHDVSGSVDVTITARELSITANSASKAYGETLTDGAGFTGFTSEGLQNGETIGSVSVAYGNGKAATDAIGSYEATISVSAAIGGTFKASNYSVSYHPGTLEVTTAPVTVVAVNKTKTYGAQNPNLEVTYQGLKNGDTAPATPAELTTTATASSAVGSYPITFSKLPSDPNYTFTTQNGSLTVSKQALTIKATVQEKPYFSTLSNGSGHTGFESTGLMNGETIGSVSVSFGAGASPTSVVGTYANSVTISNATGGTFNPSNYTISYQPANLVVVPKPVTISIANRTKVYGTALTTPVTLSNTNQTQRFTVNGLIDSKESITDVTLTVADGGASTDDVGSYKGALVLSDAKGNKQFNDNLSNYLLVYEPADLTVTPKPLTVTATAQSKAYGTVLSAGDAYAAFTSSGLVTGDIIESVSVTYESGNAANAAAQTYTNAIKISDAVGVSFTASNYDITYVSGNLTVTKKGLTITANGNTKVYGTALTLGTSEFTVLGLEGEDSVTSATLTSAGSAANATAGSHPIVPSAASGSGLDNYQITYVNGSLSVTPKPLEITAKNLEKVYGNPLTFAGDEFTQVGLESFDAITSVSFESEGAQVTASVLDGPYEILPSNAQGARLGNYTITYKKGSLVITPAELTIRADDKSKVFGSTDPELSVTFDGLKNEDTPDRFEGDLTLEREEGEQSGEYEVSASGVSNPNYDITFEPGTFTVTKKVLTVTADNQQKVYNGSTFTGFASTITGFHGADNSSVVKGDVTYTGSATTATDAGTWVITPDVRGLTAYNYQFESVSGELEIKPVAMVVKAVDVVREYDGSPITEELLSVEKETDVDLLSIIYTQSTPRFSGSALGAIHPGDYEIVPHGLENPNFVYQYVPGTLSIVQNRIMLDSDPSPKLDDIRSNPVQNEGTSIGQLIIDQSIYYDGESRSYPAEAIYITSLDETNGYWEYSLAEGVGEWVRIALKTGDALVLSAEDRIRFVPDEDYYGSASLTFGAWDTGFKIPVGGLVDAINPVGYKTTPFRASFDNGVYTLEKTEGSNQPNSNVKVEANYAGAFTSFSFEYMRYYLTSVDYVDVRVSDDGENWETVYVIPANEKDGPRNTVIQDTEWQPLSISLMDEKYADVRFVQIFTRTLSGPGAYFKAKNFQFTSVIPFSEQTDDATVTVRPILQVVAGNKTKVYDAEVYDADLYSVSLIGVEGYEIDVDVEDLEVTYSVDPAAPQTVGTYTITPSGKSGTLISDLYWVEYTAGTLTITPKALTITANDLSKTYGVLMEYEGVEFKAEGLQGEDTVESVSLSSDGDPATAKGFDANGEAIEYAIKATEAIGSDLTNYEITYVDGKLKINKSALSVTAADQSKVYGEADPELTYEITEGSLVGDDAFTGALTRSEGEDVGSYDITQGTLALDANYELTYNGAELDITLRAITVTAADQSKVYGEDDPELTYEITEGSLVGDDAFTGALTRAEGEDVGSYDITQGTLALDANYELTYEDATLDITKAKLTLTANNLSKVYGTLMQYEGDEFEVDGLVGEDTLTTLDLSSDGDAVTAPGFEANGQPIPYQITYSNPVGTGLNNYEITFNPGTLTITQRDLYITANELTKTYGSNMVYQGTEFITTTPEEFVENGPSGLVNGDVVASVSLTSTGNSFNAPVVDVTNERAAYPVIPSAATGTGLSNYQITYIDGSLSIDAKPLFIQANGIIKEYDGQSLDNSLYTVVYDGFAPGERSDNLGGQLVFGGDAVEATEVGFYPIEPSGYTSTNYDINYINGILTIRDTTPPVIVVTEPTQEENESLEYEFDKETYKGIIDITVPEGTIDLLTLGTNEIATLQITEDLLDLFSLDENGSFTFKSPGVVGVYTAVVTATDTYGSTSQVTITVRVIDVTPPDITLVQPISEDATFQEVSDREARRLEVTIRNGASFVAQLGSEETVEWVTSALDQENYDAISDSPDDPYSKPSDTEDDLITIDADGNITFKEVPAPGVYYVNVFAIDESGNHKRVAVKVNVLDYIPPVITITEPEESEIVFNQESNRFEVDIVMNEDLTDVTGFASNEPVVWSLAGGADEDLFTIDENGKLTFKDPSVFGVYNVVVKATDELGNETLIYVKVTVIDEVPPVINVTEPNNYDLNRIIDEQTQEPFLEFSIFEDDVEVALFVSDEEVTWSLDGANADLFEIDEDGNLSFKEASEVGTYNLVVKGTDKGGNEATLNVRVIVLPRDLTPPVLSILDPADVPIDVDPVTEEEYVYLEIYEVEQFVARFSADEDVLWNILDNTDALLSVDNSGEVMFSKPSVPGQYSVLLQATDASGNSSLVRVNVFVRRISRISGVLFEDLNNNGLKDAGEPALSGWNVKLENAENTLTTESDENGTYLFEKFDFGTYTLTAEVKEEYLIDAPVNATKSLTFDDQNSKQLQDFPYYRYVSLGGLTYIDIDGSREYDGEFDTLNPNALIELKNEDGEVISTTRSDASARYAFTELRPGRYLLSINLEGADRRVSEPYSFNFADEYNLFLESNSNSLELDFGIYEPIVLEGNVYIVRPGDEDNTSNNTPLPPGVSVVGIRTGPAPMKRANDSQPNQDIEVFLGELDEFGNFRFDGILPGTYEIGARVPGAWLSATENPITKVVEKSEFVEVGFGIQVDPEAPAEVMESSISGTVFLNIPIGANMLKSEPDRLANQTVTLTGLSQRGTAIERTVTTDRRGYYIIDQLPAGRYKLVVGPTETGLSVDLPLNTAHYVDLGEQEYLGSQNFDRLDPEKIPYRRDLGHAMLAVLVDTDLDGKADTRVDVTTLWDLEMQALDATTKRKKVNLETVTGLGVSKDDLISTSTLTRSKSEGYVQFGVEDPFISVSSDLAFTLVDRTVRTEKEVEWIGTFTRWPIRHTVLTAKEPVIVRDRFGKINGRILAAELRPMSGFDYTLDRANFSDAPVSYGTSRATTKDEALVANRRIVYPREGARHLLPPSTATPEIFLGDQVSALPDGFPTSTASGTLDDDGVEMTRRASPGDTLSVVIRPNGSAYLNAWADWNGSGYFDFDEKVIDTLFVKPGIDSVMVKVVVPQSSKKGNTFLRFRYSTMAATGPTGLALNGEVEDYMLELGDVISAEGQMMHTSSTDILPNLPAEFALGQNYPNPFNPTTVIPFDLPSASNVRLAVYDVTGRLVRTLIDGRMEAGRHQFHFNASRMSSGVYLIRFEAGAKQFTNKMTLIK